MDIVAVMPVLRFFNIDLIAGNSVMLQLLNNGKGTHVDQGNGPIEDPHIPTGTYSNVRISFLIFSIYRCRPVWK